MKSILRLVLCCTLWPLSTAAQPTPQPRDDRVVGDAAWIDSADPTSDFKRDLSEGSLHFIELTGQGPVLPGLGAIRHFMCYSQHAGTKVIDVGYCMVNADTDLQLRQRAYEYGEGYNTLLLSYLDRSGLNDCGTGVDWDAAWAAVTQWAGSVGPGNRGTTKLDRRNVRIYLNDFARHEAAAAEVCALLQKHGLDREYGVEVSPRKDINTDRENDKVYRLICKPEIRTLTTG